MWLWNHDSEFTKWQHTAMWHVVLGWHATEFARWQHPAIWHLALGSWHWIRQVAAPCNVAGGSGMTCYEFAQTSAMLEFYIWFRFWPYFCSQHILHQSAKFYPNQTTLGRENWRYVDFQDGGSQPSWILGIQQWFCIGKIGQNLCNHTSYRKVDRPAKLPSPWCTMWSKQHLSAVHPVTYSLPWVRCLFDGLHRSSTFRFSGSSIQTMIRIGLKS